MYYTFIPFGKELIFVRLVVLKNDLEEFLNQINMIVSNGFDATVLMHGYYAVVYAYSDRESVRRGIISKLKTIKMREQNLRALRRDAELSDLEFGRISACDPETIADCCLEEGVIALPKSKAM